MATEAIHPPPIYHGFDSSNAELLNKRKADGPNNSQLSDPPPKRIAVLDEEEFKSKDSESDSESEMEMEMSELDSDDFNPEREWVDYYSDEDPPKEVPSDYEMLEWPEYPEWVDATPKKPHELQNQTILEYFFNEEEFINVLAHKVMQNTQLKHLTDDLMLSLSKLDDDHAVFAGKVSDLVNCPHFIQACSDTYFADTGFNGCVFFISFIYTYKDGKPPQERMKNLREDPFLQRILEQTESLSITRGVLSALLGFWSDDALYDKVTSAIFINRRTNK